MSYISSHALEIGSAEVHTGRGLLRFCVSFGIQGA
jgi:hypothetical protein